MKIKKLLIVLWGFYLGIGLLFAGPGEPVAGENILSNPGFELWEDPNDIYSAPTDWSAPMNAASRESTQKIEGGFALKISNPRILQNLTQELSSIDHNFVEGDTYRLTINYYVETSATDQNDVSLASYWYSSRDWELTHDEEILNNGTYFTSVGKWEKKEFITTVPAGATSFYFRLKIGKTTTVIFDDFSMCKLSDSSEPAQIIVEPETLAAFKAFPAGVDSSRSVRVTGRNLTQSISVSFDGPDAAVFSASVTGIAADAMSTNLKIYYRPTSEGSHTATMTLRSEGAEPVAITLNGTCSSEFAPMITVNAEDLTSFSVKLGEKMAQTVSVSAKNMTDYVQVKMDGDDKVHFKISTTFLGKDIENLPLTITYEPQSEGTHSVNVIFYSTKDQLEEILTVNGVCGKIDTNWLETFETMSTDLIAGDTFVSGKKGDWHLVKALIGNDAEKDVFEGTRSVRLTDDHAFVAMDFDVLDSVETVSFMVATGKDAADAVNYGVYVSTDYGLNWNLIGDTLTAPAGGIKKTEILRVAQVGPVRIRIEKINGGTAQTLNIDDFSLQLSPAETYPDFDLLLALDESNPLSLLQEYFTDSRHNKPLAKTGWRNMMLKGQRPWWTYQHKDSETGQILDYSVKATAFMSNVENPGDFEMWLVTPALNGKNTESKLFTFRVMGDLLPENEDPDTKIELYYMEKDGDTHFKSLIQVDMPTIKDFNGEWREFHIDLSQSEIADVFFMAFRFAAPGGKGNSAVYYIDDVTYGRTDVPVISSNPTEIRFEADQYKVTSSDTIRISGKNLTESITVGFTGDHPSCFSASAETLAPEGGALVLNFLSMQPGVHSAYLRLGSRGAADIFVPITVTVKEAKPTIIVAQDDLQQQLVIAEGEDEAVSEPIIVNGLILTDSIYLTLEGKDAGLFRLSRDIMRGDGLNESFTVTFAPGETRQAEAEASIRLKSKGAQDVVITLVGIDRNVANEAGQTFDVRVYRKQNTFYVEALQIEEIRVFSMKGALLERKSCTGRDLVEIRMDSYAQGVYILQVVGKQGSRQLKIVR